ncbi:MAG: acetate/propionate family kinase [Thermodesulfobacteriota bacterium]|nr:MAG: acetate/propionate family kinase [Thermodesulfobacteriota bacterium]
MGNVLTINSGSSSIKFSVYAPGNSRLLFGRLERIGLPEGAFLAFDGNGAALLEERMRFQDHVPALKALFDWLKKRPEGEGIRAVGHRVVHGGRITSPRVIDPELMDTLRALVPFAAEHLPHEIKAIDAVGKYLPGLPQAACFDTSFHTSMPPASRTLSIPREIRAEGVERYGFHGLSYEYIMEELKRIDPEGASGRVVIAHLGNGASMSAVKGGMCIDTTMGFTPLGGLVMSTRTGDLDPGVIVYMLKKKGLGADELNEVLNRKSGLLGISGISPDMSDLLEKEGSSNEAALAVEVFCRQAKKFLGAFAAVLGGIGTLVFTAGMGENSPVIRERILEGLGFLGIEIDPEENRINGPVISRGPVMVRVMKTNEELMIARHARRVVGLG